MDAPVAAPEPSAFRLIFTLGFAGFLAGVGIVGAYEATKSTIAANRERELREAVFMVVPGAVKLQEVPLEAGSIYATYDDNNVFTGWALPSQGTGFQDVIKLIYGYNPDTRLIMGMHVLQSLETPGLGDKIRKDETFLAGFKALAVDPKIVPVKAGEKQRPNEVDCITGATISSKAVVRILNTGNATWLEALPEPPEVQQ